MSCSTICIQWNPSKAATIGTKDFGRYTGVAVTQESYKSRPLKRPLGSCWKLQYVDNKSYWTTLFMALKAVTGEHGLLFVKETLKKVELAVRLCAINRIVGGAGRSERSFCIDGHHLGPKSVAVIRWPQIRGFLSIILYGDAVGTKVSGRYRQGGRSSGVAVKRGSTVHVYTIYMSDYSGFVLHSHPPTSLPEPGSSCSHSWYLLC